MEDKKQHSMKKITTEENGRRANEEKDRNSKW